MFRTASGPRASGVSGTLNFIFLVGMSGEGGVASPTASEDLEGGKGDEVVKEVEACTRQ